MLPRTPASQKVCPPLLIVPQAMSVVGGLPMHAALTLTAQLQLEEALGARLTQPFTSQVG